MKSCRYAASRPRTLPAALAFTSLLALGGPRAGAADSAADGARLYEQACAKCHSGGPGGFFTGAPKIGSAYWATRLAAAGSADALVQSAARGKGKMPAQGGASGLSDAELRAAVDYLLAYPGK